MYVSSASLTGYGFHEDGLKVLYLCVTTCLPNFSDNISLMCFHVQFMLDMWENLWYNIEIDECVQAGKSAAQDLLGNESGLLVNPKQMIPSWTEAGARLLVARFLGQYISVGNLVWVLLPIDKYITEMSSCDSSHLINSACSLLEEGGTMFSFGEAGKKCHAKSVLRVHDPMFYWKVLFSLLTILVHYLSWFRSLMSCEIHSSGCNRSRPWLGRRLYQWLFLFCWQERRSSESFPSKLILWSRDMKIYTSRYLYIYIVLFPL
jgi:hypothetical protein